MLKNKVGDRPDAKLKCYNCSARWTSKQYKNTCPKCGNLYVEWLNSEECLDWANKIREPK